MPFDKKIRAAVYLEGVRIPAASINVATQLGEPGRALVATPITETIWKLPRGASMLILASHDDWVTDYILFDGYFTGVSSEKYANGAGMVSLMGQSAPFAMSRIRYFEMSPDTAGAAGAAVQTSVTMGAYTKTAGIEQTAVAYDAATQTAANDLVTDFGTDKFGDALTKTIKKMCSPKQRYPFMERATSERLMPERFFAASEENEALFSKDIFKKYVGGIANSMGGLYSAHDLIGTILGAGFRDYAELSPIGKSVGKVRQVLGKPLIHFLPPPSCNVFFRSDLQALNYSIDYASMPTRAYFTRVPTLVGSDPIVRLVIAPSDQFGPVDVSSKSEAPSAWGTESSTGGDSRTETPATTATSGASADHGPYWYDSSWMTVSQKGVAEKVAKSAERAGVDVKIAIAICMQESSLNENVRENINSNKTKDIGPMQINSSHIGSTYSVGGTRATVTEAVMRDPQSNIDIGVDVIRQCYSRAQGKYSGDMLVKATYVGYNAGPGNIGRIEPNRAVDNKVLGYYTKLCGGTSTDPSSQSTGVAPGNTGTSPGDTYPRTADEDLLGLNLQMYEFPLQAYNILTGIADKSGEKTGQTSPDQPAPGGWGTQAAPSGSDTTQTETSGASGTPDGWQHLASIPYVQQPDGSQSTVTISFSNTADGASSDNAIQPGIKECFEKGVKLACKSVKITDIGISATTNGDHGDGFSWHAFGCAIDINRINGKRCAEIGNQNPTKALQEALNRTGSNENFGPCGLYKGGSSHAGSESLASSHKNHIHLSVRGKNITAPEAKKGTGGTKDATDSGAGHEGGAGAPNQQALTEGQQLADFVFYLNYYAPNTATVALPWSPFIAIGFPAIIVDTSDEDGSMLGYVAGTSYSLDANGMATTTVSLTHYRHYTARRPKFEPALAGNPLLPMWFDKAFFGTQAISNKFYKEYLGNSVFSVSDLSPDDPWVQEKWIEALKKEYPSILRASDPGKFQKRELMTFSDWKTWQGVTGTTEVLEGRMFHGKPNPIIAGSLSEHIEWKTYAMDHEISLRAPGHAL